MWRMLQADRPDDYVLATGTATTVGQWVEYCFDHVGLDWREHVRFDESYLRPTEVDALIGDASKARATLGWEARTMPGQLAKIMVEADLAEHTGERVRPERPALPPRPAPVAGG
jgi:GDPmannose 4,6-dehydratase